MKKIGTYNATTIANIFAGIDDAGKKSLQLLANENKKIVLIEIVAGMWVPHDLSRPSKSLSRIISHQRKAGNAVIYCTNGFIFQAKGKEIQRLEKVAFPFEKDTRQYDTRHKIEPVPSYIRAFNSGKGSATKGRYNAGRSQVSYISHSRGYANR